MTNILFVNQSLIDFTSSVLLVAIFVVPMPPLPTNTVLARFVCTFWHTQFLYWVTYAASVVNLTLMALERYLAVVYPIPYRRVSAKVMRVLALIPWVYGCLHMTYLMTIARIEDGICHRFQWPNEIMQPAIGIFTFVMLYSGPFGIITAAYIKIVRTLRQTPMGGKDEMNSTHQKADYRGRARRNVIRTIFTVSVCYCVCYTPNVTIFVFFCFGGDVDLNGLVYTLTVCIAFINVWINPFVYTFQYRKFQQGLKYMCHCRRSSQRSNTSDMYTVEMTQSG
ncbi:galanin receptor 2b-like [Diadema setosum]|uniref:galanin receptor 2b-like n=1 Tax=Diadema setosum TaxID=31175 RepID=UPI003B3B897B